jgi:hypothetical protein
MIYISNFDTEYKGKNFKDTSAPSGTVYACIGYGDNQGNPYLVGITNGQTGVIIRTVLLKNVEIVP